MTAPEQPKPQILPLGDQGLMVVFGDGVDVDLNRRACAFAERLRAQAWPFVTDVVPGFTGVGLHYRAEAVPVAPARSPFLRLQAMLDDLLDASNKGVSTGAARTVDVPVCYGGEHGPDLAGLTQRSKLSHKELIARHTGLTAQVFMLGFAPGLPYLGLWDEAFDPPRRDTPRTLVPAGSVAIANRQTVIYPFDLPGGWHLIGRTPLQMFDPHREGEQALLNPGDQVRFFAISAGEFEAMSEIGRP